MRGLFTILSFSISTFLYFTFFIYDKSKVLIPIFFLSICYFAISYFPPRKSYLYFLVKWFLLLSIWFLFTIYFPIIFSGSKFEISSSITNNLCLLLLAILLCEYDNDGITHKKSIINSLSFVLYILSLITNIYQFLQGEYFTAVLHSIAVSLLFYFLYKQAIFLLEHKKRNLIADLILLFYLAMIDLFSFFFIS